MSQNNLHTLSDLTYPSGGATPDYIPPDIVYGSQGTGGTSTTVTVTAGSTFPYKVVDVPSGATAQFASLDITSAFTGSEVEGEWALTTKSNTGGTNNTHINRSCIIPNGVLVTKFGITTTTSTTFTLKMCRQESSTQYSIIDIGTFSHPGTGVSWYTLPVPFRVPNTGIWNPGIYTSAGPVAFWNSGVSGRNGAYRNGNYTGDSVGSFNATTNEDYGIGVKYQPLVYSVGYGSETEWQTLESGSSNTGAGYTLLNGSYTLTNNSIITQIGFYSTSSITGCVGKIARLVSGTTFYPLNIGATFNHPGTGSYYYTLPAPFRVPSYGTWYVGIYIPSQGGNSQKAYTGRTAYYVGGNVTNTETAVSTYSSGYYCVSAKGYANAAAMGAYDLGRVDAFSYSGPNRIIGANSVYIFKAGTDTGSGGSVDVTVNYQSAGFTVPRGRYYKAGWRSGGQYQDTRNMHSYWDIAASMDVSLAGTYSPGASAGFLGTKVNNSWYSLFMLGDTKNDILALPMLRVGSVSYSSPNTTITMYDHDKFDSMTWLKILTTDGTVSWANYTLRQVIPSSELLVSGSKIRVTLLAKSNGANSFDYVSIVERSPGSSNGTTTPTEITFGGSSGVSILAGSSATSDWIDFSLDRTKDYLLIIDFSSATQQCRYLPSAGVAYTKTNADSWNTQDLSGATQDAHVYYVTRIEATYGTNNSFVSTNDIFNGYRVAKLDIDNTNGIVATISDSIDGTPDQIVLSGCQVYPPMRFDAAAVYDLARDKILIFGGQGETYCLNDLWSYDPSTRSWTPLSPSGTPPSVRLGHSIIYDVVGDAVLVFGGCNYGTSYNDLYKYTISTNTWSTLSPSGGPSARAWHLSVYDSSNRYMWVFGGSTNTSSPTYYNDLYKYDIGANTWTSVSPTGPPSVRRMMCGVYDAGGGNIIVFGGRDSSVSLQDTWSYNISGNTWTSKSPSGPPSLRCRAASCYDSTNRTMIIFGGHDSSVNSPLSTFYKYDIAANTWTLLSTVGSIPAGRTALQYSGTYDPVNKKFVIFFGTNQVTNYIDDQCNTGSPSASAVYSGLAAFGTFDNSHLSVWGNNNALPSQLQYDFGSGNAKVIGRYRIFFQPNTPSWASYSYSPKNWTFEGSNNGSSWTTLDTQTNQTWASDVWKEYTIANPDIYRYYRINISAAGSGTYVCIHDLEMVQPQYECFREVIEYDIQTTRLNQRGPTNLDLVEGDWLQVVPPDNTPCLYLSCIRIDGSGNILKFIKKGWAYHWYTGYVVGNSSNRGNIRGINVYMGTSVSPTAYRTWFSLYDTHVPNSNAFYNRLYAGDSDSMAIYLWWNGSYSAANATYETSAEWVFSSVNLATIRIGTAGYSTYVIPVSQSYFRVRGFEE